MTGEDRMLGGLLGAVAGDALGVPVEFCSREECKRSPVAGMRGFASHNQPVGTWSDDSSMMLCLAESIVQAGWSVEDQAARYARWAFESYMTPHGQVFDIGGTTARALERYRGGTPAHACGGRDERDNGNGALMRILPAALSFAHAPEEMLVRAIDASAAVTHAHPRSRLACVYYALLVSELLQRPGNANDLPEAHVKANRIGQAVSAANARLTHVLTRFPQLAAERDHVRRLLDGTLARLPEAEIRSGGYVIDTLESAVWCLLGSTSYPECVLKAVNLGGDTDTTATVAGGLAGLVWGASSIPVEWIDALARRREIEALLRSLVECCNRPVPFPGCYWVVPGRLLAGEYPRTRDEAASLTKLEALLDAGVSVCVDLTEAGEYNWPPYHELLSGVARTRGLQTSVQRFPVPDGGVPTVATVRGAHTLIDESLQSGDVVYVHCWGGHGRTGMVIGTWLIHRGLSDPREVVECLRHLRRGIPDADYPSPENDDQVAFVHRWPGPNVGSSDAMAE